MARLLRALTRHSLTAARTARNAAPLPATTTAAAAPLRTMSTHTSQAGPSRPRSPTRVPGPVETAIHQKLTDALGPTLIRIQNDSSKHSHHVAMRAQGGGSGETHFALTIVSPAFDAKSPIARHRLVNSLLKDEFDTKGLHALSLKCKTPAEWDRDVAAVQS